LFKRNNEASFLRFYCNCFVIHPFYLKKTHKIKELKKK